jgi:type IV fimbrial biogenesis protein FimT
MAAQIETDLFHARSLAVERNQVLRLNFDKHVAPGCYVLHTGTAAAQCQCDAGQTEQAVCTGSAQALRVVRLSDDQRLTLSANVNAMAFEPSRGTVTPAGTIRIDSGSGARVHLIVNIMGRTRACTPNGAAGWPAC